MKLMLQRTFSRALLVLGTILFLTVSSFAADLVITGKVQDEKGNELAGATVTVKGTSKGANTDANGNYRINVTSAEDVLVFSYIGYNKEEIIVGSKSVINVKLTPGDATLNEVVVTALGVSREARTIGYAVTTVNADVLNKARENNIGNSLAGRVAGLNVKGTNGGPGSTAKILMRGMPSINSAGSPLIVINGVPMDNTQRGSAGEWGGADGGDGLGNLNPDDIENMTVLKGQSASALYGARASNGVILITTRKGKKGDFSIEYNANLTADSPINFTDFQYEYGQGMGGLKPTTVVGAQQTARMSWGAKLDGSQVIQFDGNQYAYSAQRNNVKNFYRTGSNFTNTVSVTRGGDNGSFRISASNLDNKSTLPNSGLVRKTFNVTADQNITSKLSVSLLANYIDERITAKPQLSDGPLNANNGYLLATNIDERILAPGYNPTTGREVVFSDDNYVTNPYFVINKYINDVNRKRLISMISTKYQFASWIYAQARVGYDNSNDRINNIAPYGTDYSYQFKDGILLGSGQLNELSNAQRTELNIDGLVGINKAITPAFTIDALVGGNIRKNQYEKISIGGGPFVLPGLYSFNNVVNFNRNYEVANTEVQSGYYSVDLGYKNFLNLTTTGRYDTYSTLPSANRGIFTPSVNAALVFTDLVKVPNLSFGKLRAGYAVTSGEPTTAYGTSVYYGVGSALNGIPTGNFNSNLPNLFLKPFTKTELEVGLELKFFGNRLGLDAAVYTQKTRNEILPANYSASTGYTSGVVGTGSVQNTGLELLLTGTPVKTSKLAWNVSLNLTSVHNKVLQTDANNNPISLGSNRATLGNAITAFVVGEAGPQIRAYDYKYASNGQIIVDASGLPVRGDLINMGTVLPTLYGGLNNEFIFGGFNLSFLIDYNYGNKILSATENYAYRRGLEKATLVGRETGITTGVVEGGAANTVRASAQDYYTALANNVTKVSVLDGDFIKFRQLTFGYNVPAALLTKVPLIRAVNISLVGRNLFYITKKATNIDPESSFGANLRYSGIEGASLPSVRNYGVNLNIKFK